MKKRMTYKGEASKKINIGFLIDHLCLICGLTRNLLEIVKWIDKERFNIYIYVLDGSRIINEFKTLNAVKIINIKFNKFNPFSYFKIIGLLRSDNIEIVYCYPFVSNLIGPLLSKASGVKKIITSIHSETIIKSKIIAGITYGLSDIVVVVSNYLKEFLKSKKYVDSDRVKVVYNVIDSEFFNPEKNRFIDRKKIGISDNDILVMTVSTMRWERGYEYLTQAIAKIKESKNRFKFIFIGDGPLEESIKSLARDLRVEDKILFMGYRDDVYELLPLCDIFVLPSISEGVGLIAMMEAMAMKKPVITTAVGGIPEVVENEENGFLLKPADPDGLKDALYRLAEDKLLRERMGRRGREIVEKNFDSRTSIKKIEKLYLSVLAG